ncbi:MAG: hypothetical protein IPG71_08445 [bacterium]|nr:hypothetical protein [bacterium]
MFRLTVVLLCLLFQLQFAAATDAPHHALIRVFGNDPWHEKALVRDDELDILPQDDAPGVLIAALPEDFAYLQNLGYRWDVIEPDLEEFYARRAREAGSLDDMGGYKTHSEIVAALDTIHANHPSITTTRFAVGTTIEGRNIECIKISDNPDVDEDEIELLYNSLIHAREPAAMEVLFLFMNYLTDQYGINTEVTNLVNEREFFFVPCINVDGYLYNQQTNPNGGGMWRKNRRNNGGSYGVDLNRNWGFNWGYDNEGSSPTPSSDVYRGTGPFSEPETSSLRDFIESRNFTLSMNYHTYSNLILFAWGTSSYQGGFTPDQATFSLMGDSMQYYIQQVNGAVYSVGPAWQLLYDVNGDCNDWCYGEQSTKNKIYSFTTEVGGPSDGFWPLPTRINPLAQENLPANMFVARYAINLVPPDYQIKKISQDQIEQSGDGDGIIEPGEQVQMYIELRNTGALDLSAISGTLTSTTPNISVVTSNASWPMLANLDSAENSTPFLISVGGGFSSPGPINCSLHLTSVEGLDTTIAVTAVVGIPTYVDMLETGAPGWTHNGVQDQWHVSTRRAASPTHSFYCGSETGGTYNSNQNAVLTSPQILLGDGAVLTFSHRYQLETDYDFGFVEVSDGNSSILVAGPFTGDNGTFETVSLPLTQFSPGSMVQIKFRQTSDGAVVMEGWFVDDISVGPPPHAFVSPAAVVVAMDTNQTTDRDVIISNVGGSDLSYQALFQNGTAAADTGGPDAFGYRWQDSDDQCGPDYAWLPISALGEQIVWLEGEGDQVRGPYALPFNFPFYGVDYAQIYVSANGWISFNDLSNEAYINAALPSATAASAAIFAWWDDLKPQLAGTNIRYWSNGLDSAAVLYENVRAGTAPNQGTYNFQILLTAWGECRVFYGNMGTIRLTSATIGIQNAAKNVGLTALHNQAGVINFESRRFALGPRWVSVLPVTGVVQPNSADTLRLHFLGPELCGNPSLSGLVLRTNDPDAVEVTIPITVTPLSALPAPLDLTIVPDGNDVILRWQAVPGASSYRVEFMYETDGIPTIVGTPVTTTYTHINALDTAIGFYQVRALP